MVLRSVVLAGVLLTCAGLSSPPGLEVRGAWTRPASMGMNAAGYMTIVNSGPFPDRLTSASSPAAARVSIHESMKMGAVMSMHSVPALRVPSHGQAVLAPGGYHLMIEGLKQNLRLGQTLPLDLTFARAGLRRVRLQIRTSAP